MLLQSTPKTHDQRVSSGTSQDYYRRGIMISKPGSRSWSYFQLTRIRHRKRILFTTYFTELLGTNPATQRFQREWLLIGEKLVIFCKQSFKAYLQPCFWAEVKRLNFKMWCDRLKKPVSWVLSFEFTTPISHWVKSLFHKNYPSGFQTSANNNKKG